jgi:hypothetical protein
VEVGMTISVMRVEGDVALYAQISGGFVVGFCAQYPGAEAKLLPGVIGTPVGALVGEWDLVTAESVPLPLRATTAVMHAHLAWNMGRVH